MKDFLSICKQAQLHKKSAALLTPEAEAAAVPTQDPNAMGGMPPQGGMPMDPSMMGGQPPMDPNTGMPMDPSMMGGDPNAMGGMPVEQDMGQGMPQDMMNNMASIIMDSVDSVIDQRMAALDKKISAFADKLDSIKSMLDDLALGTDTAVKKQQLDNDKLNAQLEADLRGAQQPQQQQQLAGTQDLMKSASVKEIKPVRSILDIMRG